MMLITSSVHTVSQVLLSGALNFLLFLQLFFLEEKRKQCLQDLATLIQKIYRGWKCRTHFLLMKKSQIVVAAWYRRYAVRPFNYTKIQSGLKTILTDA